MTTRGSFRIVRIVGTSHKRKWEELPTPTQRQGPGDNPQAGTNSTLLMRPPRLDCSEVCV